MQLLLLSYPCCTCTTGQPQGEKVSETGAGNDSREGTGQSEFCLGDA